VRGGHRGAGDGVLRMSYISTPVISKYGI
jgi:hypothetical protein